MKFDSICIFRVEHDLLFSKFNCWILSDLADDGYLLWCVFCNWLDKFRNISMGHIVMHWILFMQISEKFHVTHWESVTLRVLYTWQPAASYCTLISGFGHIVVFLLCITTCPNISHGESHIGLCKKTISCSEIWLNVELINGWNQKIKTRENMNRRRWNKREGEHLPRVRKMGIRRG